MKPIFHPHSFPGLLIAFEGIDGTGKSSQIQLLAATLRGQGREVVTTREPTDGEYGQRIRQLYVKRDTVSREEELALFVADRREHVAQVIAPALAAGKVVLTDRYYFSTAAYQGANGLNVDDILRQNESFAPRPGLVLLLQIPVAEGLRRIRQLRGERPDSFEGEEYLARVAAVYDRLAGENIVRLDGLGSVDEVQARVLAAVLPLLAIDEQPPVTTK
jgi:dTMP kinase